MSFLRRINHKHETEIPLDRKELAIGRDPESDICIDKYDGISRNHCGFRLYEDGVVTLTDFSSRNGTYVNGKQIFSETRLNHHDKIRVCSQVEFEFIDPDSPEAKNEERIRAKQEELKKRAIVVDGDKDLSDAMTEVNEELRNRDFKSLMSELVDEARHKPKGKTHPPPTKHDGDLP